MGFQTFLTKKYILPASAIMGFFLFSTTVFAGNVVSLKAFHLASENKQNVPVTIAHVFKEGDILSSETLGGRLPDGSVIPLQVNKKATHNDGSLRHAIITASFADFSANASKNITLFTKPNENMATGLTVQNLLDSGFDAETVLNVAGKAYTANARDFLQNNNLLQWLSGPLVSEWIVGGTAVAADGTAHKHLAVYFHIRAYNETPLEHVRVDVIVENGWTMVPGPNLFTMDANISVGGSNVYSVMDLDQKHHSRWRKTFWWKNEPQIYAQQDSIYMQMTKAVPHYEVTNISESLLSGLRGRDIDPMTVGDFRESMGATGAHKSIAPLPRWVAAYIISGDKRAYDAMLANGDAGGAYYSHYRDEQTMYPMKVTDHPNADLQSTGGTGEFPSVSGGNDGVSVKLSHLPSIAYVPYLVTGDYFYLEELQFWANYGPMWRERKTRNYGDGLIYGTQVRGQAWGLREMARAAYATPDDHDMKNYFVNMLNNNINWYNANYADPAGYKHNSIGTMDAKPARRVSNRPWMDDFFTYAIGHVVELDFTNAIPMRDFKGKYISGRLGYFGDFCWQFPTQYGGSTGPDELSIFNDFKELFDFNWGKLSANGVLLKDVACGTPDMQAWLDAHDPSYAPHQLHQIHKKAGNPFVATSYYANMQPAAAVIADSGLPGADLVRERFFEITPVQPDYSSSPEWGIAPREQASSKPRPSQPQMLELKRK